MTKNISEPTPERVLARHGYDIRQLQRRPSPVSPAPPPIATLHIKLFSDSQVVTASSTVTRFQEQIAEDMGDLSLTNVEIFVSTASTSGIVEVQLRKNGVNMLSTTVRIDATEFNSADSATAYVISPAQASVNWEDKIDVFVLQAGTGTRGLGIHLEFS